MEAFFAKVEEILLPIVAKFNEYLSSYMLIILLIAIGLYFTIRTRFVQVRCFGEGIKNVFGNFSLSGGKQKGGLSSFQALATAIAAQVGTGNIVGACGAILIGGPGTIFWMWVIAFFGMATIYGEAIAAQKTRVVDEDGTVHGGPVYYIRSVFKGKFGKFLAAFFAVAAILALGFMGSMVQSNSIAESMNTAFNIPNWVVGIALVIIAGFIFIGGVQRLGSVTEKMVPFMAILYIIGGIIVLIVRGEYILDAFAMIFKYAFNSNAILGGSIGGAIYLAATQGAKRGLFSNEAGMGSTPHAHAQANVKDPHEQGVSAMIGVFIDTFVVLTFTALVVISTLFTGDGALNPANYADGQFLSGAAEAAGLAKTNLAQVAFGNAFGNMNIGSIFVAICLFFFAFSTILSWNLFGRINAVYLFGKKSNMIYSIIAVVFVFMGCMLSNDLVWELTDMFNYLMVLPNVLALFFFGKAVSESAKKKKAEKAKITEDAQAE
ncbi:MAG: amino acid carrier protein [Oscillospiraceae bacterium]|nr:amino acid carrier protein [Oscillospiraceae bacterium]